MLLLRNSGSLAAAARNPGNACHEVDLPGLQNTSMYSALRASIRLFTKIDGFNCEHHGFFVMALRVSHRDVANKFDPIKFSPLHFIRATLIHPDNDTVR
jgi:hypothetical protein